MTDKTYAEFIELIDQTYKVVTTGGLNIGQDHMKVDESLRLVHRSLHILKNKLTNYHMGVPNP